METNAPLSEAEDHAGVPILPPYVLGGALALSLLLHLAVPFTFGGGLEGRILGGMLIAGGGVLLYTCWKLFQKGGTNIRPDHPSSQLIQEGPYQYSRNPMYLALLLIYFGSAMLLAIGWFYVFLPAVLTYLRFVAIAREEAYLMRRFPEEYMAYSHRVGRWL